MTIADPRFDGPEGVAVGDGAAWVTYTNSRNVVRIDAGSNRATQQVTLDQGLVPWGVAVGAGLVWVTVTAP